MVARRQLPRVSSMLSSWLDITALKACRQREWARRSALGMALLLALSPGCRKKPAYVWECSESIASKPSQRNSCSCLLSDLLVDAREAPEEKLCARKYECCVVTTDVTQSQAPRTTCECWNPSQGGSTCESKLPPAGQESFLWKRVDRCAKW